MRDIHLVEKRVDISLPSSFYVVLYESIHFGVYLTPKNEAEVYTFVGYCIVLGVPGRQCILLSSGILRVDIAATPSFT